MSNVFFIEREIYLLQLQFQREGWHLYLCEKKFKGVWKVYADDTDPETAFTT